MTMKLVLHLKDYPWTPNRMIKINQNFHLQKKVFEAIDILRNKEKKHPDTKSVYELIKKNCDISIRESEMKNFIDEMINKKSIYNNKLTRDWILYIKY